MDELISSRSVVGKDFTNFEMLDAKIASFSEQDSSRFHTSRRRSVSRSRKSQKGLVSTRKTDCAKVISCAS